MHDNVFVPMRLQTRGGAENPLHLEEEMHASSEQKCSNPRETIGAKMESAQAEARVCSGTNSKLLKACSGTNSKCVAASRAVSNLAVVREKSPSEDAPHSENASSSNAGRMRFPRQECSRSEKRDISATRTSSGTIFGAWETSGAGLDDGFEYFVVLQHCNKTPCINPATQ